MKKDKDSEKLEENPFEGFNLLDAPTPPTKGAEKKVENKEVNDDIKPATQTVDDELSEEELAALEKTAAKQTNSKEKSKSKKEELKEEKEEDGEGEPSKGSPLEEDSDENEFIGFARFLNEKSVIDFNEEEDKIESEEDLAKIVSKTIQRGIQNDRERLPEDAQKFLEFIDNGGNPSDFHKYYYGESSFEEFDITDSEENQKYVIKESMKLEGYSDEEIEDELNDLVDLGKLDKKATTHLKKLQKIEKEQKTLLIEAQKQYAKEQEAKRIEEWNKFKNGLFEKEALAGFKLTPKMKNDLWDYMSKPDRKTGMTQYQIDSKENEDARYMFAYLLKNKWNIEALEKQVETKAVSKLRSKLSNYSDSRQKLKGPKTDIQREEGTNPFEGFKNLV